ncbi:MAG: tetratricopeptide repeat protein [Alphaproteobacteria bacterium]|nr:MAG: tetratricopeptide repeat protein [Alphaproteobacteria bacterium]
MDLIDEIKEDLRSEQMRQVWKNYGKLIMAAIAVLVLGTALTSGYKQYSQYRASNDAALFDQAVDLADAKKKDEALKQLAQIADDASSGYKTLALFTQASIKFKDGDKKGAIEAYDQLANAGGIDPMYRELATIDSVSIQMDMEGANLDGLSKRLEPLTATGRPWRFSALELQGLIAMQKGDKEKAKNIFDRIAKDENSPVSMRMRVQRVATVLSY